MTTWTILADLQHALIAAVPTIGIQLNREKHHITVGVEFAHLPALVEFCRTTGRSIEYVKTPSVGRACRRISIDPKEL